MSDDILAACREEDREWLASLLAAKQRADKRRECKRMAKEAKGYRFMELSQKDDDDEM